MGSFFINLYVPSLGKKLRFKEFNNLLLLNILKFITNKDSKGFSDYIDFLIQENLLDKEFKDILNCFDKLVIMLQYKAININQELKFTIKNNDEKEASLSYNLFNIIKELTEKEFVTKTEIELSDSIFIGLTIPNSLYIENFDTIFSECLSYIRYGEDRVFLNSLPLDEKNKVLDSITGDKLNKVISFFDLSNNSSKNVSFMSENSKLPELNSLKVNFFNNSLISFLELVYLENLLSYFEFVYVMVNKVRLKLSEFFNLVPSESLLLYNLFKKDIEEQNKEIEQIGKKDKGPTIAKP